jgi:hypothetical protein
MSKPVTLTTLTPTHSGKFLQCYSNQFSTSANLSEAKFFCRMDFNQFKDLDVVEITNTMHRFAPLLYSTCWLLHVSAVVCHRQGASGSVWVTWKSDRFGGRLDNVCLSVLCFGVSWFSLLCFPARKMCIYPSQGQPELRGNKKKVLFLLFWILAIYTQSVSEAIYARFQEQRRTELKMVQCVNR